jgi:hypothetical protein
VRRIAAYDQAFLVPNSLATLAGRFSLVRISLGFIVFTVASSIPNAMRRFFWALRRLFLAAFDFVGRVLFWFRCSVVAMSVVVFPAE